MIIAQFPFPQVFGVKNKYFHYTINIRYRLAWLVYLYARLVIWSRLFFLCECKRSNANWDRTKRIWDWTKQGWTCTFSKRIWINLRSIHVGSMAPFVFLYFKKSRPGVDCFVSAGVSSNHKLSNITMLSIVLSLNVACTYVTTEHVTDCSET